MDNESPYTREERHAIYEQTLKLFLADQFGQERHGLGICYYMGKCEIEYYNHIEHFPELLAFKPLTPEIKQCSYWWFLNLEGDTLRRQALEACIEQTRPTPTKP